MYGPDRTQNRCTFTSAKLKGLTRAGFTFGVERATKQKEPLILEMAPVYQRAIGEMELVPSAVRPNEIEQRYKTAEVRTQRRK